MLNKVFDYTNYRQVVLNYIDSSKYHLVNHEDYQKYKKYTSYIFDFDYKKQKPLTHMVGYFIPTVDGKRWMPIFNNDIGRLRNKLNLELNRKYLIIQNKRLDKILECLLNIGFPLTTLNIIREYLEKIYFL